MRRLVPMVLCVPLALACELPEDESPASDAEFAEAIPDADGVALKVPEANGQALTAGDATVAVYYVLSRNLVRDLNGAVAHVLGLAHAIVSSPATEREPGRRVWGPWTADLEPLAYRFVVERAGADVYDWSLEARPRNDPAAAFVAVLHGRHHRVLPHRGDGSFVLDWDAAAAVDPTAGARPYERGQIRATYDNGGADTAVALQLAEVPLREDPATRIDASYAYARTAAGPGELTYGTLLDLDGDAAADRLAVHTRWRADGAGRADVAAAATAWPGLLVQASECWAGDFLRAYYADNVGGTAAGDEAAACVFPAAAFPALAP
jgi:hypothetical protein